MRLRRSVLTTGVAVGVVAVLGAVRWSVRGPRSEEVRVPPAASALPSGLPRETAPRWPTVTRPTYPPEAAEYVTPSPVAAALPGDRPGEPPRAEPAPRPRHPLTQAEPSPEPTRPPVVVPPQVTPPGTRMTTPTGMAAGGAVLGGFLQSTIGEDGAGIPEAGTATAAPAGPGETPAPGPGGPEGPGPPQLTITVIEEPPRFRQVGIAIGDAVEILATDEVAFPLTLELSFDPAETAVKGVEPDELEVFFFDQEAGVWSQDGITVIEVDDAEHVVQFETDHLTVFRLGVPRGDPPLIQQLEPLHGAPASLLTVLGSDLNAIAARNVLSVGGAYVMISLDASGTPQPLGLDDGGDTIELLSATAVALDQATLAAAPAERSSWTRQPEADSGSPFVDHLSVSASLFSPGTTAAAAPFSVTPGGVARPPVAGELVLNEILLAPPGTFLGDANRDGETDADADEFVELVNTTAGPLDLGGCRLVTSQGERHRFPEGTILPGGMAMVVFGVDDVDSPPRPGGAFGGVRFLPNESSSSRMVAELPEGVSAGSSFLTASTLRQGSNPVPVQILVELGEGALDFEEASALVPILEDRSPRLVRAGDLDRDLDVDLVAVDEHEALVVLLNSGAGSFVDASAGLSLPGGRNRAFDLVLADVTGDGAPEIFLGDTDADGTYTQLIVLENSGGGQFTLLDTVGVATNLNDVGPRALAVGDLEGDGDADVVVAMAGDGPKLFRNDGGNTWSHLPPTDELPQDGVVSPTAVRLADVDRDGDLDILLAAGRAGLGAFSALQLFRNDGTGAVEDVTTLQVPHVEAGVEALAAGDLDGDSAPDLVVTSATAARVYRNDGAGHFTEQLVGAPGIAGGRAVAVADVDGDGDLDAIVGKPPRDEVWLNDGTGLFAPSAALPEVPGEHREVLAADVDNDGDLDLLGAGSGISLILNAGTTVNHPPQIEPIGGQSVIEGELLEFGVVASDVDGDPLVLSVALASGEALATIGASFTDHGDGTGTVQWTSGEDQGLLGGRLYTLRAEADDGLATVQRDVSVFVHDFDLPPTLSPVDPVTVEELELLGFQLDAQDPDAGDVLTFGAINQPSGSTLNATTGLFAWTPGPTQGDGAGGFLEYPVTFTVTDLAGRTAEQATTITVLDVNHAPQFTAPDPTQSVAEGTELAFVVQALDPDADPVAVSARTLPAGADFHTATRAFSWTPSFVQARAAPYLAEFEASDGDLSSTLEVEIAVQNVNRPPTFVGLTDESVQEEDTLEFEVVAEDLDGDPLTLDVLGLPGGAAFTPATGHFAWTPGAADVGDHDVTFTVTDGLVPQPVEQTITIHVVDVNHVPVLGAPDDVEVLEGHRLEVAIDVSDADGDPLTVEVAPLPDGARLVEVTSALWLFEWVPSGEQAGTYALTVELDDGIIQTPVSAPWTVTVVNNPGVQPLLASAGLIQPDAAPATTGASAFGAVTFVSLEPGTSVVLDLGAVHPALVSGLEVFDTVAPVGLPGSELALYVSDDNVSYAPYDGPAASHTAGNRLVLSNLNLPERFIKLHRPASSSAGLSAITNFLTQVVRPSGAIPLDAERAAFLDDLGQRTFQYFSEHVTAHGLIPDRVAVINGDAFPGDVYSTAATGFWLAALPIAAERGWVTPLEAEAFARRTLEFYLGDDGGPVAGQFGMFYHFLNEDGTRFTGFGDDGVSIIDSTLLFAGALACGEYFGGDIATLATRLYEAADWEAFYDHAMNLLRLFWTPEGGFVRHLDYTSEGILAYLFAAGSSTHPILADPDLPGGGADAYYAYSRGSFGRVLGRFDRDGRPLLQSFFGSLFTYLYPSLLTDLDGVRDAFNTAWPANTREAILANFRFAQTQPAFGYGRLFWGISASDGPSGYQGLYGTPPLDPGAGGEIHDGTVAPYAVAGSLPFGADLALPALQHLATLESGRLFARYGLRSGVNLVEGFFDPDYLGLDQGALLLGLEAYRTGLVGELVGASAVVQQAMTALGFGAPTAYPLVATGPRSAHAYLLVDTTEGLTRTIQVAAPNLAVAGEVLLELHPFGIDTALGEGFVDVEVAVNGSFVKTVRFLDRRTTGTVDVGSVYVPLEPGLFTAGPNEISLTWVDGERWVQLEDVELRGPTGRQGTQEIWALGDRDASSAPFAAERFVDDSHLVGDDLGTLERALNVVDEPRTDLLFELSDLGVDRLLRLVAETTQNGQPVTVEVSLNNAVVGQVTPAGNGEATVALSRTLLREGWNHVGLRHANIPTDGEFIVWDQLALERQTVVDGFEVLVRDVADDELAPEVAFGPRASGGDIVPAQQYLDIHFEQDASFLGLTIATDNRAAPIHRYTGPAEASAAGLVGEVDSTITVPLLWQVYDTPQSTAPAFTDTIEWAFVPDVSEPNFDTQGALDFRTIMDGDELGDRPSPGRPASSPIALYLVGDFRGKPAQRYGTDRLLIELFRQ